MHNDVLNIYFINLHVYFFYLIAPPPTTTPLPTTTTKSVIPKQHNTKGNYLGIIFEIQAN